MSDDLTKRVDALMRREPTSAKEVPVLTDVVSEDRKPRREVDTNALEALARELERAVLDRLTPEIERLIEERVARTLSTALGKELEGVRSHLQVSVTQMVREAVAASVQRALKSSDSK